MEKRILTRHPQKGKKGVNIRQAQYDVVRDAILDSLRAKREITLTDLTRAVNRKLRGKFESSISWYVTTIKLDLEARKVIERVPASSPQRLRLVAG